MAISFKNIDFSYDGKNKILDSFSLTLPERGAICLFGPSGCGKTTLLRLVAGLEKPQRGEIKGLGNKRVAVVFQENRLLPWMSVLDNVAIVNNCASSRKIAEKYLKSVGLENKAYMHIDELSGGMKRRVAIARALAVQADILILDEPFVGLESMLWASIADEILSYYADKSIILVTHLIEQAKALNAQILYIDGPPLHILNESDTKNNSSVLDN